METQRQRTVLIDESVVAAQWRPNGVDVKLIDESDVVCVGGSLPDAVLVDTLDIARRTGTSAVANPTRIRDLRAIDFEEVRLVQVSRDDFENFGMSQDAAAAALADPILSAGAEFVVITDSANGEWAFAQGGQSVRMPAVPDRNPLYPTGCGDASFAAHLAGILAGLNFYDWVNVGSLAGAFFVENGFPAKWADIAALAQEWQPERRMEMLY